MSQAKVDQYKKEKANRKQIMAKEKAKRTIAKICGAIVGIAVVVWIGVSAVAFVKANIPVETIYAKTDAIDDYLTELYAEDTESTESSDETESSDDTETTEDTEAAE